MNRDKAVRTAITERLTELGIQFAGSNIAVPVYDNKLESDDQIYVIIEAQTATKDENFLFLSWRCTVELTIYHVQQNSATFDAVDLVSEQIEERLLLKPAVGDIIEQEGWQIDGLYLSSVNSFKMSNYNGEAGTLVTKTLQFSCQTIKR